MEDDRERDLLREHIQEMLYSYARTHCTTDYIQFTTDVVAEFIEYLRIIPTTDPNALTLPTDPMSFILQLNKIDTLMADEEKIEVMPEAIAFVKSRIQELKGKPKSERIVWDDDDSMPEIEPLPCVPMVTARARRETPKLGKGIFLNNALRSLDQMMKVDKAPVEEIVDPKVSTSEVLQAEFQVSPEEKEGVRKTFSIMATMLRPRTTTVLDFLDRPEPPLLMPELDFEFLPAFSRASRPDPRPETPLRFENVPNSEAEEARILLPPIQVMDSDDDLPRQNMRVIDVDGWATIPSSPDLDSDTSPSSSQEDVVDQLEFPLTPDTDLPVIEDLAMDILVPRSRRIGGLDGVQNHILKGKTYESMLVEFLPKRDVIPPPVAPSSPGAATSVLGQASTVAPSSDDDVWMKFCPQEDLYELIFEERIDDNNAFHLEVPSLPEPTVHPCGIFLPTSYRDWAGGKQASDHRLFYKKARIPQSLALSLSWVPFRVDHQLPTIAEVVDVETPLSVKGEPVDRGLQTAIEEIAKHFIDVEDYAITEKVVRDWNTWDCSEPEGTMAGHDIFQENTLLLSRLERMRLVGKRKAPVDEAPDYSSPALDSINAAEPERSHVSKRTKMEAGKGDGVGSTGGYREGRPALETHQALDNEISVAYSEDDKENWDPSSDVEHGDSILEDYAQGPFVPHHSPNFQGYRNHEMDIEQFEAYGSGQDRFESLPIETQSNGPTPPKVDQAQTASYTERDSNEKDGDSVEIVDTPRKEVDRPFSLRGTKASVNLFNCSLGAANFAQLRSAKVSEPSKESVTETLLEPESPVEPVPEGPSKKGPPLELFDKNTIQLNQHPMTYPISLHRYLGSLYLLQRRALVNSLHSRECMVELIERNCLDNVHLILDPLTCILFIPLLTLSSKAPEWIQLISTQSPKYRYINVIFEAFPESCALRSTERRSELCAYTPPVLKAVKKFRRDLGIAEAYCKELAVCRVVCAFADSVNDAAKFVRLLGDLARDRDETGGVLWDDRGWLDVEPEDVENLACTRSINHFAASVILAQVSLEELLEMDPETRISLFGCYVGMDAIMGFNQELEERYASRIKESSDSFVEDVDTGTDI